MPQLAVPRTTQQRTKRRLHLQQLLLERWQDLLLDKLQLRNFAFAIRLRQL
jgi:hypothetical protein